MKRWPAVVLFFNTVAIALLSAWPVLAQPPGADGIVMPAAGEFLKQGILGALVVLEGVVIWYLYKQVQLANAKFLEMAVKQTEIFAAATQTLKRNEEMIEKVLDVVISPRR